MFVILCLKKKNQTAKPNAKQMKQNKLLILKIFSQNNMKIYFLTPESIKDPSICKQLIRGHISYYAATTTLLRKQGH